MTVIYARCNSCGEHVTEDEHFGSRGCFYCQPQGPCPACEGRGVFVTEPRDWWHGSGVNAEEHQCAECNGTGEL